ncbi:hypothetical protein BDZ89DRAFT_609376 [Hymenopellis radicata]|nr:hypothetical protein BDZ89DRAFT_609376 [Hymenopellis radicata]
MAKMGRRTTLGRIARVEDTANGVAAASYPQAHGGSSGYNTIQVNTHVNIYPNHMEGLPPNERDLAQTLPEPHQRAADYFAYDSRPPPPYSASQNAARADPNQVRTWLLSPHWMHSPLTSFPRTYPLLVCRDHSNFGQSMLNSFTLTATLGVRTCRPLQVQGISIIMAAVRRAKSGRSFSLGRHHARSLDLTRTLPWIKLASRRILIKGTIYLTVVNLCDGTPEDTRR